MRLHEGVSTGRLTGVAAMRKVHVQGGLCRSIHFYRVCRLVAFEWLRIASLQVWRGACEHCTALTPWCTHAAPAVGGAGFRFWSSWRRVYR